MKQWFYMLTLLVVVTALCVWDTVHTSKTFEYMEKESKEIYNTVLTTDLTNQDLQDKIFNLNDYWTKNMDTLAISISRKDMQPVSDYLQYLCASVINNSKEDAITYACILSYNLEGLNEITGISFINIL